MFSEKQRQKEPQLPYIEQSLWKSDDQGSVWMKFQNHSQKWILSRNIP